MAERLKITEFRVFRDDLDMKLNKIMTTAETNKIKQEETNGGIFETIDKFKM